MKIEGYSTDDLYLKVARDNWEALRIGIEQGLRDGWKIFPKEKWRVPDSDRTWFKYTCDARPEANRLPALLCLVNRGDETLYVPNVVPLGEDCQQLKSEQYNAILADFRTRVLERLVLPFPVVMHHRERREGQY